MTLQVAYYNPQGFQYHEILALNKFISQGEFVSALKIWSLIYIILHKKISKTKVYRYAQPICDLEVSKGMKNIVYNSEFCKHIF